MLVKLAKATVILAMASGSVVLSAGGGAGAVQTDQMNLLRPPKMRRTGPPMWQPRPSSLMPWTRVEEAEGGLV